MKNRMIVGAVILCVAGTAFGQGSLTPPGAPGETMKTLQQVEPRIDIETLATGGGYQYEISQPGSYYLSSNLIISNSFGIAINSHDVSLDLNGFKILHAGGQSDMAIRANGSRITIKNGSISDFDEAIYAPGSDGIYPLRGCHFENLMISTCQEYGLFVGVNSTVVNCHFSQVRGPAALFAAANSSIQNCTTDNSSGGHGFQLGNGSRVFNCSATDSGDDGFNVGSNSVFNACTASLNDGDGFQLLKATRVTGCTSSMNGGSGFDLGVACQSFDCTASGNTGDGFKLSDDCLLRGAVASENENGVRYENWGENVKIENSILNNNIGNGIVSYDGWTVEGCTVSANGRSGIDVDGDNNKIKNNHCSYNERDGIYTYFGEGWLDGNVTCDNGRYGIYSSSSTSVTRNYMAENSTNYYFTGYSDCQVATGFRVSSNAWDNVYR